MGDLRFESRGYVVVVVETDAGITGIGFGMTRNAPVGAIIARNVAPLVLGQDPLLTEALWERIYYRNLTLGGQGLFMRALSAVDIALWDIKGQAAGMPVWQLLGGARQRTAISVAGGYPLAGRDDDDLAAEMDDYARRGFSTVKIAGDLAHGHAPDPWRARRWPAAPIGLRRPLGLAHADRCRADGPRLA